MQNFHKYVFKLPLGTPRLTRKNCTAIQIMLRVQRGEHVGLECQFVKIEQYL